MAVTLLGIYWIGFALAHAVLLRGLPHGMGIVIDVLVGTFLGDTGAYFGGTPVRAPTARAADLAEQDRRGPARSAWSFAVLGVWFAGRYQDWLPGRTRSCSGSASRWRRRRRPVRVVRQARGRHQGLGRPSSARTAGRSTGSTRCCSRPSSHCIWRLCYSSRARHYDSAQAAADPRLDRLDRHAGARRRRAQRASSSSSAFRRALVGGAGRAGRATHGVGRIALVDDDAAARAGRRGPAARCSSGPEGLVAAGRRVWRRSRAERARRLGRPRPDGRDARRGHRPRAGQQGVAGRRRRAGDCAGRGDGRADRPGRLRARGAAPAARRPAPRGGRAADDHRERRALPRPQPRASSRT